MHVLNERYVLVENEKPRTGGMAEVHRAFDVVNGQPVAIKFFKTEIEAGRLHVEAYSRECRALQRLDHPNIVRVLDVGTDDESGRRFLVLEWLETSLVQHVAAQPLPGWDTFYEDIGRPILDGLVYAYSRDVLHRDLKPHNVLFSADGVIKVVDFRHLKTEILRFAGVDRGWFPVGAVHSPGVRRWNKQRVPRRVRLRGTRSRVP